MIIGSSNLTSGALSKNKEWNLKISAQESSYIMRNALEEFTNEFNKATIVTKDWLVSYYNLYSKSRVVNQKNNATADIYLKKYFLTRCRRRRY